jgi:predicted DNA-binding transcriptional regulator AlpA
VSPIYGAPGYLAVEQTDDARPTALLTVTGLGVVSVSVRITRTVSGVALTVPGALAWDVVDSGVLRDYAAPLNVQTTYTLWVNGVIADVKTFTVVSATAWLQDPRQPDRALPVYVDESVIGALTMRAEALQQIDYNAASSRMTVMGDRLPVSFGGQRMAPQGLDASVSTYESETADSLRELISEAPILLLRTVPEMVPLPPVVYLLANVSEIPQNVHIGGGFTAWSVTGDFVRPVLQQVVSGFLTYDDVQAVLGVYTYDEVQTLAAGTTYLDWSKNPLIFTTL